jgi:type IX secretion system PorP/SprF family membrane protein
MVDNIRWIGMILLKRILLTVPLLMIITIGLVYGQQIPMHPISYRIFDPFVFNPAIAGSKDFSSIDLILNNYGKSYSQLCSGNLRISRSQKEYFSSIETPEFTNVGIGGYFFNNNDEQVRNYGAGATGSYHLQLDKNALSFLSFGISAKAIFNNYKGDPDNSIPAKESFIPNIDAGAYYYFTSFFIGISVTNLLNNTIDNNGTGLYPVPVSRQYFLNSGYKFVISKQKNMIIEPFLIVNVNDSLSGEISEMLKPGLKLFFQDFCVGSYFDDFSKISFFAQLQFSRIFAGAYFEFPYKSAFYLDPVIAEIAFGINLSALRSGFQRWNHW